MLWSKSARDELGKRFERLSETGEEVGRIERKEVERVNVKALVDWGGKELERRLQMLDEVVTGVWALGEPGGAV